MKAKLKIISNRDGTTGDRAVSFTGYTPNSYSVYLAGDPVGDIEWLHAYPLSRINPLWSGCGAWVFYNYQSGQGLARQKLNDLRTSLSHFNQL